MGFRMRRISGMLSELRQPHIGEYVTKTNAIRAHRRRPAAPWSGRRRAFEEGFLGLLLTVTDKDLIAGLGQLGAKLLQAAENGEVAIVHYRPAVSLNVRGTGPVLLGRSAVLLLLGHRSGRDRQRQQSSYEESLTHCVPLFLRQRFRTRIVIASAGRRFGPPTTARTSAGKCGQICDDRLPKLRPSKADFEKQVTDWHHAIFFGSGRMAIAARRELENTRSLDPFASKKMRLPQFVRERQKFVAERQKPASERRVSNYLLNQTHRRSTKTRARKNTARGQRHIQRGN